VIFGFVADGVIAPVSALSVDQGRRSPTARGRYSDPALAAGEALAKLLTDRGISVDGVVRRATATASATDVGAVASPTMAALVERMLTYSDNDLAEALLDRILENGRHVEIGGKSWRTGRDDAAPRQDQESERTTPAQ
jgi:D-alanyl-D-alanine carboxypeptidase